MCEIYTSHVPLLEGRKMACMDTINHAGVFLCRPLSWPFVTGYWRKEGGCLSVKTFASEMDKTAPAAFCLLSRIGQFSNNLGEYAVSNLNFPPLHTVFDSSCHVTSHLNSIHNASKLQAMPYSSMPLLLFLSEAM